MPAAAAVWTRREIKHPCPLVWYPLVPRTSSPISAPAAVPAPPLQFANCSAAPVPLLRLECGRTALPPPRRNERDGGLPLASTLSSPGGVPAPLPYPLRDAVPTVYCCCGCRSPAAAPVPLLRSIRISPPVVGASVPSTDAVELHTGSVILHTGSIILLTGSVLLHTGFFTLFVHRLRGGPRSPVGPAPSRSVVLCRSAFLHPLGSSRGRGATTERS